jgi:hypothetical protein
LRLAKTKATTMRKLSKVEREEAAEMSQLLTDSFIESSNRLI